MTRPALQRVRTAVITAAVLGTGCLSLSSCAQPAPPIPQPSATPASAQQANYRLLIHCEIRWARFDGDTWEAVPPIPSIPQYVDGPDGTSASRIEIAGHMVRTSAAEATFTTTEPPVGVVIRFVRSTAERPLCA